MTHEMTFIQLIESSQFASRTYVCVLQLAFAFQLRICTEWEKAAQKNARNQLVVWFLLLGGLYVFNRPHQQRGVCSDLVVCLSSCWVASRHFSELTCDGDGFFARCLYQINCDCHCHWSLQLSLKKKFPD